MSYFLNLRYSTSGGPVRVFVNGFLIINDLAGESSSARLEPYVQPGKNLLRVQSRAAPQASVAAQVVALQQQGGSNESVLAKVQLPRPDAPGGMVEVAFNLPPSMPVWGWSSLLPAPADADASVYAFLVMLATLLRDGPDDQLLGHLQHKHSEVGAALGIGKGAMDQGLVRGLATRSAVQGFQVTLAAQHDVALVWSPDRRLARAMRSDGSDAVMIRSDGMWSGFEITLGFNQGRWIVIR